LEVYILAGKPIKDGEDDQVLNNRPPDLVNDYGIPGEEDALDQELMPDASTKVDSTKK
jgi:hypothetical protein